MDNNNNLKKIDEIEEYKTFNEKNPEYYRSIHIWVRPGDGRKELYEVEDISNLIAEIQIRSALAQGWADVSHEVYYKPKLPKELADEHKNVIIEDLKTESVKLAEIDKTFIDLRKTYKNKLDEFKKESKKGTL